MPNSADESQEREQQLNAIIAAYYRSEEVGEAPNKAEFIEMYPSFAHELKEFFSNIGILGALNTDGVLFGSTNTLSSATGARLAGRYRLDRVLGEGAYGIVYLGFDEELRRQVAVKVPTNERFQKPEDAEAYLTEARTVASLNDSHIVPVYDMGRTQNGSVYVVSKFIDGQTLADRIKAGPLTHHESAELMKTVARALQHAHDRRLIHRDVKPANILLESEANRPYLADFGLAIREEDYLEQNAITGTPSYMSPEQARGEGHRLDGRSDIFSMGIILYELLTGRQAFRGSSPLETVRQVISMDLKPPREIRDTIPVELERICLKALAKLTSDRYSTAAEFADDLEQWLKPKSGKAQVSARVQVVSKGLRSFEAADADFFLELLPGPRNREGLPESIAFWKKRIEQTDPEKTFNVGLLIGPSGCGKSSLVKAGLLPNLSDHVIAVYVEATQEDTETRIIRGLRRFLPDLVEHPELTDTLAALRRGQGHKVVIIIDQFEQWLHAHRADPESELVKALRQCDGGRLQAIVMLRDDFSMAASRFMRSLDTRIIEGYNFATVDLFEVSHAAKVLTQFGQSFHKIPANSDDLSPDERQFVNDVVLGLATDGKIVSVRLSLFADMVRNKPWTAATLKQVGGTEGIGINFLEETFSSLQANPDHRRHGVAARNVLRALLPELGTEIRGHMRSKVELLAASGYQDQPSTFAELLRILDGELRLITPTDPEGHDQGDSCDDRSLLLPTLFYQLTHDYLVSSLRDWLNRKQKETRKGRAELTLDERAAIWHLKQENRQLPTVIEWLNIRVLTDSKRWTESERTMMQRAARVHGTLWGGLLLMVLFIGVGMQQWASAERLKSLQDQTRAAAESLQNNLGQTVPVNLQVLKNLPPELVIPELHTRFASATNSRHKLSLAFALAGYGELDAGYLASRIDDIADVDTGNYVTALQSNPSVALHALDAEALKCTHKSLWRRKARLSIVALGLGATELALDVCTFENRPDHEQRTFFIDEFPRWDVDLKTVLNALKNCDSPALRSGICLAVGQVPAEKIIDADRESWKSVASRWFVEHGDTSTHSAAAWMLRQWKLHLPEIPSPHSITPQRDWFVVETNGATMLRVRSIHSDFSEIPNPLQKYKSELKVLETLAPADLKKPEILESRALALFHSGRLVEALNDFTCLMKDGTGASQSVLQYLTLALARLGRADEAKASMAKYVQTNPGISNQLYVQIQVSAWLGDIPEASRQLESAVKAAATPNTLYNLACAAALCAMATAEHDSERSQQFRNQALEILQRLSNVGYRKVDYASQDPDFAILHGDPRFASILTAMTSLAEFWVADREVTRGQFEAFINDENYSVNEKPVAWRGFDTKTSPTADHPAQGVNWHDAVLYCNWLSHREKLQPCYVRSDVKEKDRSGKSGDYSWRLIAGANGYRLLIDAEWENACRAGTATAFSSGDDETLLSNYCQMYPLKLPSSCGEKLPNAWGLHDFHGNMVEWVWDTAYNEEGILSRILRGGSFGSVASMARSDYLLTNLPIVRKYIYGFRVARNFGPDAVAVLRTAD